MPEISIVIVNYNSREALRRTLQSIQAQRGGIDLEVIVVDNASKDGSADMVRETMPEAIVIEPGRNTWFTGGNNLGAARASGDFLYILNPDTIFQPGMLGAMLDYLRAHPHVGAVTCQMRGLDHSLQSTCSRIPQYLDLLLGYTFLGVLLSPIRDRRRAEMWYKGWERDTNRAVEVVPDSNLLMRTPLAKSIGVFDERLKLYFTEDDICKRILDTGCEIHFVADALLLHEEHVSTRQVQRLASQVYFDDLLAFSRKHYGTPRTLLLQALIAPTRMAMDWAQRLRGERKAL